MVLVSTGSDNGLLPIRRQAIFCCVIVNWTLRNKLQWNFHQNTKVFVHENASQNVVSEITAILSFMSIIPRHLPCVYVICITDIINTYTMHVRYRFISHIPQWSKRISHNASLQKRNVHAWAQFCHNVVLCGIWYWCILGCVKWIYWNAIHIWYYSVCVLNLYYKWMNEWWTTITLRRH